MSMDTVLQATQRDGAARSMDLERGKSTEADECRICLQGVEVAPLIHACQCSGTAAVAHLSCLTRWAVEAKSCKCEICKQDYNEPFLTQIKEKIEAQHGPLDRGSTYSWTSDLGSEALPPSARWKNIVWYLFMVILFMGIVVYISVFSNLAYQSSDSWTGILWRVLTGAILAYCAGRCVVALVVRWKAQRQLQRLRAMRQAIREQQLALEQATANPPAASTSAAVPGDSASQAQAPAPVLYTALAGGAPSPAIVPHPSGTAATSTQAAGAASAEVAPSQVEVLVCQGGTVVVQPATVGTVSGARVQGGHIVASSSDSSSPAQESPYPQVPPATATVSVPAVSPGTAPLTRP